MSDIILRDKISRTEDIKYVKMPPQHRSGIYQRTQIIGGYDLQVRNGVSSLGETTFSESNMIPIGGCQYSFEQLFGVNGPLEVPTLYDISEGTIGIPNVSVLGYQSSGENIKYYVPALAGDIDSKEIIHPAGELVCLFGVGITGSATNVTTKPPVSYMEHSIQHSLATEDGSLVNSVMIPFRYTSSKLTDTEMIKYFGKTGQWSITNTEPIGYYLKRFESDPVIKHFWKAATDETESTNEVEQGEYYPRVNAINTGIPETYIEMILKITPKDLKEWFDATDNIDATRINTIATFVGRYNRVQKDYENVRLFSKLCFNPTSFALTRDFIIIYRIYSS